MRSTDAWAEAVCQPTVMSTNDRTRALVFIVVSSTHVFSDAAILRASRRHGKSGTTQYRSSCRSQDMGTSRFARYRRSTAKLWPGRGGPKTAASGARRQQAEDFAQALADGVQIGRSSGGERQRGLLLIALGFGAQVLPGAGDREAFLVKQLFDAQNALHVLAAIHALAGAALDRLKLGELGLPETQNVSRKTAQACHFADAEVEPFRDYDFSGLGFASRTHRLWEVRERLRNWNINFPTRVSSTSRLPGQPLFSI